MDNLSLYYDMIVKKDDKVIKKYRKRKCHSFVRQFIDLLYAGCSKGVNTVILDTSNTNRTYCVLDNSYITHDVHIMTNAPVSNATYGPQVGTGVTAVSINDYKIETIINHGIGSGQLQYSAVTFGAPTTTAAGTTFIVTRVFTNGSGNSITINEISIVVTAGASDYLHLIVHDNLVSPVTLANGETVTLNYTFQTTI